MANQKSWAGCCHQTAKYRQLRAWVTDVGLGETLDSQKSAGCGHITDAGLGGKARQSRTAGRDETMRTLGWMATLDSPNQEALIHT